MSLKDKKILLVGCGKMGGALLNGWLKQDWCKPENITVVEPSFVPVKVDKVNYVTEFNKLSSNDFDVCVFAIKPQAFDEIVPDYNSLKQGCLYVSIAAGKSVKALNTLLGEGKAIVRVMPNLPASIGAGFSAYFFNGFKNYLPEHPIVFRNLFESTGFAFEVIKEEDIDKITALSGSGPAYFYYFIECLKKAAENLGFSSDHAKTIARETAIGSIALLEKEGDAESLRKAVTSKGGTTEAGLNILMDGRLQNIVEETVNAALKRVEELNS